MCAVCKCISLARYGLQGTPVSVPNKWRCGWRWRCCFYVRFSLIFLSLSYSFITMFPFLSEFMPLQLSIDFRLVPTTDWGWNTKHIQRIWYSKTMQVNYDNIATMSAFYCILICTRKTPLTERELWMCFIATILKHPRGVLTCWKYKYFETNTIWEILISLYQSL